jgi:hypothetical protein
MALLNGMAKPANAPEPAMGQATAARTIEEKKAAKIEAAKRHAEKVAQQKRDFYANALAFRDELIKQNVYDQLSQKAKDFVVAACKNPAESSQPASGTQLFVTLFGMSAQPGDSITLLDAFQKVPIAKAAFEKKFKEWSEKGKPAVIEVIQGANVMQTTYKIVSIAL